MRKARVGVEVIRKLPNGTTKIKCVEPKELMSIKSAAAYCNNVYSREDGRSYKARPLYKTVEAEIIITELPLKKKRR